MWLKFTVRQLIQYHHHHYQQQTQQQLFNFIFSRFQSKFQQKQQLFEENSSQSEYKKNIYKNMVEEKPKIVFVLGPPGAGKGTQCANIVNQYNYEHLSAGDLLREERARDGSEVGALIEECIRNGKIVPVEVTCSLLEDAMKRSGKHKFLIDGFPRNQDNLDGWNRQMSDKVNFQFVLFFNCSEDICITRCLGRGQGGSGRTDDNPESLKKRINTYVNDSLPIIKYFENLGQVREIDASCSTHEVFEKVKKVFE